MTPVVRFCAYFYFNKNIEVGLRITLHPFCVDICIPVGGFFRIGWINTYPDAIHLRSANRNGRRAFGLDPTREHWGV